jgi:hypothetical protein
MVVSRQRQGRIPYSGGVTGLVAGARIDPGIGWHEHRGAHDHDVELVLAFLNTIDVQQGTDVLDDPAPWRDWVSGMGFDPPRDDWTADTADQVRAVRDALRAAVTDGRAPAGGAEAPGRAVGGGVRVELLGGVPTLVAGDPLGAVLAASARLAVLGEWNRVKICPADDCRWAFFDHSRNRSRTWCSMRVCGNRTKARNWRERARLRPT